MNHRLIAALTLIAAIILVAVMAEAESITWQEDFESIADGQIPPGWYSGGGHTDFGVSSANACNGSRSLRVAGIVGQCWGGGVTTRISPDGAYPDVMALQVTIEIGDEALSGCHPRYLDITMGQNATWQLPKRFLLLVNEVGGVFGGAGVYLGDIQPNSCHSVNIVYQRLDASSVYLQYRLDQGPIIEAVDTTYTYEDNLSWLQFWAPEGTCWFDDIAVTVGDYDVSIESSSWGAVKAMFR